MSSKENFDKRIKELLGEPDEFFGYKTKDEKIMNCYYNNDVFCDFIKDMDTNHRQNYLDGSGGELCEKKGKYGWVPPKMASVASSSRFIYLSLKDNSNEKMKLFDQKIQSDGYFSFEKEITIDVVGSKPNLDAVYKTKNKTLYFEAKCHEIFDSHKLIWKNAYFVDGVFYGKDKKSLQLSIGSEKPINNKNGIDQYSKSLDKSIFGLGNFKGLRMDFKQMVCHLLGIANDDSYGKELIYLIYRPDGLNNGNDNFNSYYSQLEEEFRLFCESACIRSFCKRNDICIKLFYSVNNKMVDPLQVREVLSFNFK